MRTKIEQETTGLTARSPEGPKGMDGEVRQARSRALRATLVILVPFLLAVLLGIAHRVDGVRSATRELANLAVQTGLAEEGAHLPISELAHDLAEKVYGKEHDEAATARYESLVRVIAKEVDRMPGQTADERLKNFENEAEKTLLRSSAFPTGLHAALVLFFPALFISGFWRAVQGIDQASAFQNARFPSFASYVWYQRYRHLLKRQEHWYFWRRLGFALLMGYGVIYLLAPVGVRAMVIGDYLTLNAIPGEPTYPYLLTAFGEAPPFSVGFAGFYLYSLTLFVRRFATHDLNDRIFVPLVLRGITVALLGWVLGELGEEGGLSRVLVFAVGIFPQAGLQAIAKMTQTTVDRLSQEGTSGFKTIPEIDFWKETTLQELGINDFNDLAKANIDELLFDLGMNPGVLLRAVDRSVLVHVLGAEAAEKLAAIPLFTASDLVLYARGQDAWAPNWTAVGIVPSFPRGDKLDEKMKRGREEIVEEALGAKDVCLQLEHLVHDRNVRTVIDNLVSYESL